MEWHWNQYLIEGALIGLFMIVACAGTGLIFHDASPLRRLLTADLHKRVLMGVLMGSTAVALIYSPWGYSSGAHMNPALTLTFFLLGKVAPLDAAMYVLSQFIGAAAGVLVTRAVTGRLLAHPTVNFAATIPGPAGWQVAWIAEFIMTTVMMGLVLTCSNHRELAPFTGLVAGTLVAIYIIVESPLSGMSMNPARSLASALHAGGLRHLWIYFTAPPIGMIAAAGVYVSVMGSAHIYCAKQQHSHDGPCIFRCKIEEMRSANPSQ